MVDVTAIGAAHRQLACANPRCERARLATSFEVAPLILDAVGISASRVAAVNLSFVAGEAVEITVTRYVSLGEARQIASVLEQYGVVRMEPAIAGSGDPASTEAPFPAPPGDGSPAR